MLTRKGSDMLIWIEDNMSVQEETQNPAISHPFYISPHSLPHLRFNFSFKALLIQCLTPRNHNSFKQTSKVGATVLHTRLYTSSQNTRHGDSNLVAQLCGKKKVTMGIGEVAEWWNWWQNGVRVTHDLDGSETRSMIWETCSWLVDFSENHSFRA